MRSGTLGYFIILYWPCPSLLYTWCNILSKLNISNHGLVLSGNGLQWSGQDLFVSLMDLEGLQAAVPVRLHGYVATSSSSPAGIPWRLHVALKQWCCSVCQCGTQAVPLSIAIDKPLVPTGSSEQTDQPQWGGHEGLKRNQIRILDVSNGNYTPVEGLAGYVTLMHVAAKQYCSLVGQDWTQAVHTYHHPVKSYLYPHKSRQIFLIKATSLTNKSQTQFYVLMNTGVYL